MHKRLQSFLERAGYTIDSVDMYADEPAKIVREHEAICYSLLCSRKRRKNVSKSVIFCPDCEHALVWQPRGKYDAFLGKKKNHRLRRGN